MKEKDNKFLSMSKEERRDILDVVMKALEKANINKQLITIREEINTKTELLNCVSDYDTRMKMFEELKETYEQQFKLLKQAIDLSNELDNLFRG
jgi:hypothetical protein